MKSPRLLDLSPAQKFRQSEAHNLQNRLRAENPLADEALLKMFALADPSLLLGHQPTAEKETQSSAVLHLVMDDTRRDAAAIIGTTDRLWEQPISMATQPRWQPVESKSSLLGIDTPVPNPNEMSEAELKLYWGAYFDDAVAQEQILKVFATHRNVDLSQLLLTDLTPETLEEEPLNNLHRVGMSAPSDRKRAYAREQLKGAIKHKMRQWLGQAALAPDGQHQQNIRGLHHQSAWRTRLEHRLSGSEPQIIPFPKNFTPPAMPPELPETQTDHHKYHHEARERVGAMFLGLANYLAHLPENLNWFSGMSQSLYIPSEVESQYRRLCTAESACHTFRYSAHLESTVASLISYHYPKLVSKDSLAKARTIKKNEAQFYEPPEMVAPEPQTQDPVKSFTIDPDIAQAHFKSETGLVLQLTTAQIQALWHMPASQLVTLNLNDQPRSLTAGVLRRWFHYQPQNAEPNTAVARLKD